MLDAAVVNANVTNRRVMMRGEKGIRMVGMDITENQKSLIPVATPTSDPIKRRL